jgi:DNA-binding beta-propeller fold protein YncE
VKRHGIALIAVACAIQLSSCTQPPPRGAEPKGTEGGPKYVVDPFWPKPFKEDADGVQLLVGQVAGIAVDTKNHVWIVHRPHSLLPDEVDPKTKRPRTHRCCKALPPVVEFDMEGNYVQGWGGPGEGYDWPSNGHGIYVDPQDNVWVAGNGNQDHQILKFTREGKFLMQIGRAGKSEGSSSQVQLGRPAHMVLDPVANELYVADGYGNRRVAVFDAGTGAYKRHWGAYGGTPSDEKLPPYNPSGPLSKQFGNPVHCVRLSNDGLVYVCDRVNNRIQVFDKSGRFRHEFRVEVQTLANGSVWDMVLSHDAKQRYLYVADGANGRIYILNRSDGIQVGSFGRTGRMAGEFKWIHNMDIDARGNLYTAEVGFGRRIQKFVPVDP